MPLQDHLELGLQDLFSSYQPSVPRHMWRVDYVPVLDPHEVETGRYDPDPPSDQRLRMDMEHELRASRYCW